MPPRLQNQAYLPNGTSSGPAAGATTGLSNNGRVVQASAVRILCVADVRGEANNPDTSCPHQRLTLA